MLFGFHEIVFYESEEIAVKHARSPLALPKTPKICLRRLYVSKGWFRKAFQTFSEPLAWA